MVKRKEAETIPLSNKRRATAGSTAEDDEDDEDTTELLDVEFEWFDPQEIDFLGLKVLLRQLFDADNTLFDLSGLSNLILSQPLLGSTVKVSVDEDDEESNETSTNQTDPYAFLTILSLTTHASRPELQAVASYLARKAEQTPSLLRLLPDLLANPAHHVGLILTERFINMPVAIVPPMYTMLLEEIEWAVEAKEPYSFTHYLVITKVYTEVASELDRMDQDDDNDEDDEGDTTRSSKSQQKKKKATAAAAAAASGAIDDSEIHYFHPEDEALQRHALAHGTFTYTNEASGASDAKRAFQEAGIRPLGRVILLEAAAFKDAVKAVSEFAASLG